ncbi:MAG: AAA family ATPase [Acidimicrobiales bacterium]
MEHNPFRYGAPVERAWFCDREAEVAALTRTMGEGLHAFVLSPRRYGKTSLLLKAIERFRAEGGRAGYVNLLFCTTELDVATAVLRGVLNGITTPGRRALHSVESVVRSLRIQPRFTLRADGGVDVALDPVLGTQTAPVVLEDSLALLGTLGGKRPAALVLDEFQVVASIGPNGLGGAFKAAADQATSTSLVFSGSHLSVMEKLTRSRGAPLYGMGERFVLDVIGETEMVTFLQRRARAGGKRLSKATASLLYSQAGTIPNYVQWLAHSAFEVAGADPVVTATAVEEGLRTVVLRQGGDFAERYEVLAPSQQRLVRHLATTPVSRPYAKSVLDAAGVANANSVASALRVLQDRELVDRHQGRWQVTNPFLRYWLAHRA